MKRELTSVKCLAPFTYKIVYNDVGYLPCCSRDMEQAKLGIQDWNDPIMMNIRKGLMGDDSNLHEICSECLTLGNIGVYNYYQTSNYDHIDYINVSDDGEMLEDTFDCAPYTGPVCNLGCRMCNGAISTEYNKIHPQNKQPVRHVTKDNLINPVVSTGRVGCFSGGEPLLNKQTIKVIDVCIEKESHMKMISNGSVDFDSNVVYDRLCDEDARQYISLWFSVDADWTTHEWIRCGIDIDLLKYNIDKCVSDNMLKGFNIMISTMNHDTFINAIKLAEELGILLDIGFLTYPRFFSAQQLSSHQKMEMIQTMTRYVATYGISDQNRDVFFRTIYGLTVIPESYIDFTTNSDMIYLTRSI